jgi:hypothetical protein
VLPLQCKAASLAADKAQGEYVREQIQKALA